MLNTFFMKVFAVLIFFALATLAWAQKSPELDRQKSLLSQEECQRIVQWGLIKNAQNLRVDCRLDHLNFQSEATLTPSTSDLRLGNYNILHPGTDKTLFKDFTLTAELIEQEFDVMAGVELVDVLATPKQNNQLLRPILEQKFAPLAQLRAEIATQRQTIQDLETRLASQTSSTSNELQLRLAQNEARIADNNRLLVEKDQQLRSAQADVAELSQPGFRVFGHEFGRARRLRRLAEAQALENSIKAEIATLEQRKATLDQDHAAILAEIEAGNGSQGDIDQLDQLRAALLRQLNEETRLVGEFREKSRYYRLPGYLRLLEELRKLDASWSLILSPHGDAAVETNTQELVGFYYRASRVVPARNNHCSTRFNQDSAGCYPNFYADYMGENFATLFSRRPFLATFTDGQKAFSLLASHVVFESSEEPERQREILQKAFGVEELRQLPTGINKQNYARFAEVSVSLQMVTKLREEGVPHIIYTGDLNLESRNPFWNTVFERNPGNKILVDGATSLSEPRFVRGLESRGESSNYDHFILSNEDDANCRNAKVVNFIHNEFADKIKEKYLVRVESERGPYQMSENSETLIAARSSEMDAILQDFNFTVRGNEVISGGSKGAKDMENFVSRVFTSQTDDATYYKMFVQIMSDHFPIKVECSF